MQQPPPPQPPGHPNPEAQQPPPPPSRDRPSSLGSDVQEEAGAPEHTFQPDGVPAEQCLHRGTVDTWFYVRLTPGSPLKRIHLLETSQTTYQVRLISDPVLQTADSLWHGKHTFENRGATEHPGRFDPRQRHSAPPLPEWKLCVRYDGDSTRLVHIRCLPLLWIWQRSGLIVYKGFLDGPRTGAHAALHNNLADQQAPPAPVSEHAVSILCVVGMAGQLGQLRERF